LKVIGGTVFKRRLSALDPPWWSIISPTFTTRQDDSRRHFEPPNDHTYTSVEKMPRLPFSRRHILEALAIPVSSRWTSAPDWWTSTCH